MKKLTTGIFAGILAVVASPAIAEIPVKSIASTDYVDAAIGSRAILEGAKHVRTAHNVNQNLRNLSDVIDGVNNNIKNAYNGSTTYNATNDSYKLITAGAVDDALNAFNESITEDIDTKVTKDSGLGGKMLTAVADGTDAGELMDAASLAGSAPQCDNQTECSPMLMYGENGFEWVRIVDSKFNITAGNNDLPS